MSDATQQLRTGKTIAGKYVAQRVIGRGATGVVYEAVHTFTDKHVALKLIDRTHADSEDSAARFLREARAASAIGDPRIVDVLDAGREPDGSLYLVFELLEGQSLSAAIAEGDLSVDEIVRVGIEVLQGLASAHARGVIHRDVKPDNIFLTWDDKGVLHPKILDFGIAKHVRHGSDLYSTQRGTVIGTPYYMSPEQALAHADIDPRTDIWATGAVLFHALAGRPPFVAKTYAELIVSITEHRAPSIAVLRAGLPPWLVATIDRALTREREGRWQTSEQMARALADRDTAAIDAAWDDELEEQTMRMPSLFDEDGPGDSAALLESLRTPAGGRPQTAEAPGHAPARGLAVPAAKAGQAVVAAARPPTAGVASARTSARVTAPAKARPDAASASMHKARPPAPARPARARRAHWPVLLAGVTVGLAVAVAALWAFTH